MKVLGCFASRPLAPPPMHPRPIPAPSRYPSIGRTTEYCGQRRSAFAPNSWALLCALCCACNNLGCASERGTIGAMLVQQGDRRLVVREVPPGLGAARAGLREGDEVLLIDGRDARRMSAEEVHRALAGEVGEPIKLTLIRDEQVIRAKVARTPAGPVRQRPAPPR